MIISNETINYFANNNINVRYYPEKNFSDFKNRIYNESIEGYYNYYKDHVRGSESAKKGYTNVLFDSYEELRERAVNSAKISVLKNNRGLDSYDYNVLYIDYNNRTIVKKIATKSKKIDIDYINKEISKSKKLYSGCYGSFCEKMQKLLESNNISNDFVIYPTSYGIGVWCFYNFNAKKDISLVTDIMKRNNIEYYNEFSDARWVYRFKISKKQANISKLI